MAKIEPVFRLIEFYRLSGKHLLDMPDTYLTTKRTKIAKGKRIILTLSLRVLRALRGYICHVDL
jgi:hypothetical protein